MLNECKQKLFALRLLYVEDDLNTQNVMKRILSRRFQGIVCANDGREAFEFFMQGGIDLMIVDMNVPHLDGLEFCTKVRIVDCDVPIMMVTASEELECSGELVGVGIDSFLCKPINTTLLNQGLEVLVQKAFLRKQDLLEGVVAQ